MNTVDKIFAIAISVVCIASTVVLFTTPNKVEEPETVEIRLEQPEFFLADRPTKELVKEACEYYNIQYPEIVVAQSILETGYYRSKNCKVNNNLFGLYNSNKKDYYKFNHWTESVEAYYTLVQYRYKEGDYYNWLQTIGYAEDSLYINKVKEIVKRYESDYR
jgi:flagellum-specific peptidoglycan hydrolase FlgJ